jgi:putative toxin-antitoxin system antitoxin component (TIGR02293 family)
VSLFLRQNCKFVSKLKVMKEYSLPKDIFNKVEDAGAPYYVNTIRNGIAFNAFEGILEKLSFTFSEWSSFLHISERTMQRYKKDQKKFDALQSEKILQITLLYKKGIDVFESKDNFNLWLSTPCVALGNVMPKSLLDSAFGIELVSDELNKIEYGVIG